MLDAMSPELFDEWLAWDELHKGTIRGERLLNTLANSASAICGSNGMAHEPWKVIPGEVGFEGQTEEEQQAIMEQIAARQNASM